jgi:hypothetical protein
MSSEERTDDPQKMVFKEISGLPNIAAEIKENPKVVQGCLQCKVFGTTVLGFGSAYFLYEMNISKTPNRRTGFLVGSLGLCKYF